MNVCLYADIFKCVIQKLSPALREKTVNPSDCFNIKMAIATHKIIITNIIVEFNKTLVLSNYSYKYQKSFSRCSIPKYSKGNAQDSCTMLCLYEISFNEYYNVISL